jgi:hypothetical protein
MGIEAAIVISYAHADTAWKEHLCLHLGVLQQTGQLSVWDDQRIAIGSDWRREIDAALATARVALLLVSPHFLTSKFIADVELPAVLQRRALDGLQVIPVIVEPCAWRHVDWLARIQTYPRDGTPLAGLSKYEADLALVALAGELLELVGATQSDPQPPARRGFVPQPAASIETNLSPGSTLTPGARRAGLSKLALGCAAMLGAALFIGTAVWALLSRTRAPEPEPQVSHGRIEPRAPSPSPATPRPPRPSARADEAQAARATAPLPGAEPVRVRAVHLACRGAAEVCSLLVPQLVDGLHERRIPTLSDERRALAHVVVRATLVEAREETAFGNPVQIRSYSIDGQAQLGSEGALIALAGGLVQGDLVLGRETFTERLHAVALNMGDAIESALQ